MRLVEYEYSIKTRIKKDRNDPDIYQELQRMIYMFLRRKRVGNCPKDVEDISYMIAGDLYMDILEGVEITFFLGYLDKIYKNYVSKFYEGIQGQVPFDPSIDANQVILGNPSTYDYVYARNKIYLEDIQRVVDKVMEDTCKYKPWTPAYSNLKISLMLSILRDEFVSFHLQPEQEFYLKLIIVQFYQEVKVNGLDIESSVCMQERGA